MDISREMLEALVTIHNKLDKMDSKFEARFEDMDKKIDSMDAKFEARFEEMDKKFEAMGC